MATNGVKADFGKILADEAKSWGKRLDKYRGDGNLLMAEQALGRQLEAEWLLGVFSGKLKVPAEKKAAAKKPAATAKKPAAKKPAKKAAPKKAAAKKAPAQAAKVSAAS